MNDNLQRLNSSSDAVIYVETSNSKYVILRLSPSTFPTFLSNTAAVSHIYTHALQINNNPL